jgi:cyclic-di-GMP phosphodiesterase TipF (flagellum assembly factor)
MAPRRIAFTNKALSSRINIDAKVVALLGALARNMIRISTIFIAICMVLVAASLGLILYSLAGISGSESAIVALTALTFLILYNAVSMRLRDRTDVGSQISDLSRGTADLARQVAEFGRRISAIEGRLASVNSAGSDRIQTVVSEINELGGLVKQLATSVAGHEDQLAALQTAVPAPRIEMAPAHDKPEVETPKQPPAPVPVVEKPVAPVRPVAVAAEAMPSRSQNQILTTLRTAVEDNRIDIFLQPMVTLPQRKVRYYEAVTRLRDDKDQVLAAEDFIGIAETSGLVGRIDHMVMLRCVQVLRRLMVRNKDVGVFCNVSAATIGNPGTFSQCLDFLEANRALAPSFILEFKQSTFRNLGPAETDNLASLAQRGYRFSLDHVTDLRIEPRELADRGVRFIKVPAALLLDPKQSSTSDIHPSDLSDLLGRFGIDLIAERIEGERAVVDLLDYDVRFGQGFLFAPPRPLRPEGATATNGAVNAAPANGAPATQTQEASTQATEAASVEPPLPPSQRMIGNAALARRVAGPG